tara:strand:- start:115591 stop:115785 length:195 start_codon:yes stop_codon:yes gene_type:complete
MQSKPIDHQIFLLTLAAADHHEPCDHSVRQSSFGNASQQKRVRKECCRVECEFLPDVRMVSRCF